MSGAGGDSRVLKHAALALKGAATSNLKAGAFRRRARDVLAPLTGPVDASVITALGAAPVGAKAVVAPHVLLLAALGGAAAAQVDGKVLRAAAVEAVLKTPTPQASRSVQAADAAGLWGPVFEGMSEAESASVGAALQRALLRTSGG